LNRSTRTALACSILLLAGTGGATAQEPYTFTVGLLGGLGGSADSEDVGAFDGDALQVNLGMVTNQRTHVFVRLGRIDLDRDEGFEGLTGAELEYANVAGEYRFHQGYYDFGMYLGLGAYRLKGDPLPGAVDAESALGGVFGIDGDFDVTRRLSIVAEGAAHYAFFDERSQIYLSALAGIALHF